jgi:hypothetical protein
MGTTMRDILFFLFSTFVVWKANNTYMINNFSAQKTKETFEWLKHVRNNTEKDDNLRDLWRKISLDYMPKTHNILLEAEHYKSHSSFMIGAAIGGFITLFISYSVFTIMAQCAVAGYCIYIDKELKKLTAAVKARYLDIKADLAQDEIDESKKHIERINTEIENRGK